jgi:hypothetical protein
MELDPITDAEIDNTIKVAPDGVALDPTKTQGRNHRVLIKRIRDYFAYQISTIKTELLGKAAVNHGHTLGDGAAPGFSSNDFTTEEKDKLAGLNNNETAVSIRDKLMTLTGTERLPSSAIEGLEGIGGEDNRDIIVGLTGANPAWASSEGRYGKITATSNINLAYSPDSPTGEGVTTSLNFYQDGAGNRTLDINGESVHINPVANTCTLVALHWDETTLKIYSDYTGEEVATGIVPLAAPANFTATATGQNTVDLAWSNVSGNSGYLIEQSTNGGTSWQSTATKPANSTSHQHTGLLASTSVQYRLRALGDNVNNGNSSWVTANATTANYLYFQDFESTTIGAVPTAWSKLGTAGVISSTQLGGTKALQFGSTNSLHDAFMQQKDEADGNVEVEVTVKVQTTVGVNMLLVFRSSTDTFSGTGADYYYAGINLGYTNAPDNGFFLRKRFDLGTPVDLGALKGTFASDIAYRMIAGAKTTNNITSLYAKCQRLSDNLWLNSAGTWQAGETNAHTATDSEIPGPGHCGLAFYGYNSTGNWYKNFKVTEI